MVNVLWPACMAIIGLLLGSLMNVVVYRLPKMIEKPEIQLSLWWPGSHCPQCQHPLRWLDNIPLLSWLCLHGRCRYCQQPINWHYPATEILLMAGFFAISLMFPPVPIAAGMAVFFWFGCAMSLIDLRTFLLPDALTLPLLWLGLLFHSLFSPWMLSDAVYGAVIGYLALWGLNKMCRLLLKRDGLGYGDFKLLAACGAWTGWQCLSLLLVMASILGILLALLFFKGNALKGKSIPFGPPLALAGFLVLIWLNRF
ncbi:prepilin peptidase [Trabulsiella odontotermitis]|uniref:prepilin peptidase n=1 Tax=Trabulsiella odontotermitis TaxID=379893 RepID=UPI0006BA233D|nr:A24 family peptidase [Trabulsiella odontotermitis]